MLTHRLIACFDVIGNRLTKAVNFSNNIDVGDAISYAKKMYDMGVDEIIFYDIKASAEKRSIDIETVKKVAEVVFVPFTVGGGIASVEDMHRVLKAGAEKISIDSMAVRNPEIIRQGAKAFGSQCIVLSMQVIKKPSSNLPSGYEIAIDGAKKMTGKDALEWAKMGEELGAGEIVVNSIDADGTLNGYDIEITKKISEAVKIPVIASGGAGKIQHLFDVFTKTKAQACIISSMLYSPRLEKNYSISEIKKELIEKKIPLRPY